MRREKFETREWEFFWKFSNCRHRASQRLQGWGGCRLARLAAPSRRPTMQPLASNTLDDGRGRREGRDPLGGAVSQPHGVTGVVLGWTDRSESPIA
jgi:hypothetical protein